MGWIPACAGMTFNTTFHPCLQVGGTAIKQGHLVFFLPLTLDPLPHTGAREVPSAGELNSLGDQNA
jgi:hypothetical protein